MRAPSTNDQLIIFPASVQTGLVITGGVKDPYYSGSPKSIPHIVRGSKEPGVTLRMSIGDEHQFGYLKS